MLWQLEAFKGLCRSLPDGLNSLIVCLHLLLAPAQFFATKLGEEAQTGPAEYLATSAIMSKGDYSFEAQCSLPGLTTAASAHQADQSLPDQSFTKHHGTKSPLGRLGQSSIRAEVRCSFITITEALRHSNLAGSV